LSIEPVDKERLRDYLLAEHPRQRPLRARARELATAALRPLARRRLERLRDGRELRLHLGSGLVSKDGWVDVDLAGAPANLIWDLKRGIPFEDGTVDAVFHEHLLEHLSMREGFQLTRECLRVLRPGGVLRAAVPDAGACLRSYARTGDPAWARSQPAPMLAVQALFYEHGHRAMYDAQLLVAELAAAGFTEVGPREFGDSRISPCPDTELRRAGTLYVEGVKPAPG
jgi:predicted SAM-dependent methyltransferase